MDTQVVSTHDTADGGVVDEELLKGLHLAFLGYDLSVVGDYSFDGVAHYDEVFRGRIHVLDQFVHLFRLICPTIIIIQFELFSDF